MQSEFGQKTAGCKRGSVPSYGLSGPGAKQLMIAAKQTATKKAIAITEIMVEAGLEVSVWPHSREGRSQAS